MRTWHTSNAFFVGTACWGLLGKSQMSTAGWWNSWLQFWWERSSANTGQWLWHIWTAK